MNQFMLGGVAAAILLAGCGGGGATGGGGQPPATPAAPAPAIYRLPVRSALDVASYAVIVTASPSNMTSIKYLTDATTSTSAAGAALMSFDATDTRSHGTAMALDASGGLTQDFSIGIDHDCRYVPTYFAVPASVAAGAKWDNSASKTCTARYQTRQFDVRSQGEFVAFEAVTIGAGSYDTVKLHYIETIKSSTSSETVDRVEWRDLVSGMVVKSTQNRSGTYSPQLTNTFKQDLELIGYMHAASGLSKPNVERYAGSWWGRYAGTTSGLCYLKIAASGGITGYCTADGFASWSVAGTVNAQGAATLNLSSKGLADRALSGTFPSPLAAAGSWTSATGSGSWQLTHD